MPRLAVDMSQMGSKQIHIARKLNWLPQTTISALLQRYRQLQDEHVSGIGQEDCVSQLNKKSHPPTMSTCCSVRTVSRWELRNWQRLLFTDESRFALHWVDGRVRVYRRRGERLTPGCSQKVHPYGGVDSMGRHLRWPENAPCNH